MTSRLAEIKKFGQKIWLDNLSRELLSSGKLEDLIATDKIAGVTSNPSIFHKAISSDPLYKEDVNAIKKTELDPEQRYESLVIHDIQNTCDIMAHMYKQTNGVDGYVSLEVSPHLAHDAEGTISNARRLWNTINRPNLMIKVPATKAGNIALEQLISEGINVNITLLFSLSQVLNTWQAYINGLNKRHIAGNDLSHVRAVASFFLSRIDSAIDDKLPQELQGHGAISLSKTAYLAYLDVFNSDLFKSLKEHGANEQFLLFASTGTKNPKYSDVLYVEELIGKDTINTVPDATLAAFRDHGVANNNLTKNIENAPKIIDEVNKYVNLEALGEQLQIDGLKLFEKSFDDLIALMK